MTSLPIDTVSTPLRSADETIQRFLTSSYGIAGIDLHAPSSSSSTLSLHWLCAALQTIDLLSELTRARCFLITIPLQEDMEASTVDQLSSAISSHFCDCHTWQFWCGDSSSSFFGDPVHAQKWMAFGLRDEITDRQPVFPPTVQESSPLSQCLDASLNYQSNQAFTFGEHLRSRITVPSLIPNDVAQFFPWTLFNVSKPPTQSSSTPATIAIQNTDYPAPAPIHQHDETCFERNYGVPFTDKIGMNCVRTASCAEIMRTFSFPTRVMDAMSRYQLLEQSVGLVP